MAGFVLTSPRVQPAEEAIEELCGTMAGLLDRMAVGLRAGLGDGPVQAGAASGWLGQARALGREIRRVDNALREAEESTKLNPRSLRLPYSTITWRESLETLDHEAITLRVFARSLGDNARLADQDNSLSDPDVRRRLADVLAELAAAVRTYGSLAAEFHPPGHERLRAELERHLTAAREKQDRLSWTGPLADATRRPARTTPTSTWMV